MIPYRDQSQNPISLAMSPRPGSLGGPSQQMQGQPGLPQGPLGMPTGMGRGASNAALQSMGLNNIGHPPPQQVIQGDLSEHKHPPEHNNLILLNTYIYDHLVKHGFKQAAKALLLEAEINYLPRDDGSPSNRDTDGSLLPRRTNLKRSHSGMDDHPNSSPNDKPNGKSPRSNSNSPHIGHNDLPAADVPVDNSNGFLSQWWVVFWEIFEARTNPENGTAYAKAFIEYQRNQQDVSQFQGQFAPTMQPRTQMMNGITDDMDKKSMMHAAIANNSGRKVSRPPGQQPMQMQQNQQQNSQAQLMNLRTQQQQQQQQHQHQQQLMLQREADEQNSSSPAMGQVNSPNKRPRLSPPQNDFLPTQMGNQGQVPNGMTAQQQAIHQAQQAHNHMAALNYLKSNNVPHNPNAPPQEILKQASQHVAVNQHSQKTLQAYKQNLSHQQTAQGLQAQGRIPMGGGASPANTQATIPFGNPGIPASSVQARPTPEDFEKMSAKAKALGGTLVQSSNHSLADYQNQLMVLEQQNKKRLQHARNETPGHSDDQMNGGGGPLNGQFSQHPQLQGANMSPQNSRTGPSPQMSQPEIAQQRKSGNKTASGGTSPEPGEQIRGPSPFGGGGGGMTHEQYQQMTLPQGYPQGMLMSQNAGAQFAGRQHAGMPFTQNGAHMQEVMKMSRMQQGPPSQQQYQQTWQQQQMANHQQQQQLNQQMRMVPSQPGPAPPSNAAQQQMPPPPQPQVQNGRPAPGESPSLANAPTPTPTPANKPAAKSKTTKEGGRGKRNRGKNATPATPNATEPPAPTTPITSHAAPPFGQHSQPTSQPLQPQSQPTQPPPTEQQPPPQDPTPPSGFGAIDHATDSATDGWPGGSDDKWLTELPIGFGSFSGDFPTSTFPPVGMESEIIDYGEFLNDNDAGMTMDFSNWGDSDLTGTEA